jgi:hypothetical protein
LTVTMLRMETVVLAMVVYRDDLRVMEDEKVKGMSRLTYLDSFILVRSTLTPTTRVADTMSILEMMLLEV